MEILGLLFIFVGAVLSVVGGIWFLVVAFQESILWGLGCLLLGPVSLIFLILHWAEAKVPFLVSLGGTVLLILGLVVGGVDLAEIAP